MHTALLGEGIEVSPATCARIMAANRQLYGLEKPPRSPRPKLEMPFKASRRHEYWSCDVRYIEEHLLPDPRPVYVITIFENFSRMVLSSKISATQNQWDYLAVLADALRRYGAPEALVTDGGGIFYNSQALQLYGMLGIRSALAGSADHGSDQSSSPGGLSSLYSDTSDARPSIEQT